MVVVTLNNVFFDLFRDTETALSAIGAHYPDLQDYKELPGQGHLVKADNNHFHVFPAQVRGAGPLFQRHQRAKGVAKRHKKPAYAR